MNAHGGDGFHQETPHFGCMFVCKLIILQNKINKLEIHVQRRTCPFLGSLSLQVNH